MYKVPAHIKSHVDRIIKEYELLYTQGHKVALQFLRGNRLYSGIETTKYCLDSIKNFKALLNHPTGELFSGTEFEIQKKIYQKIYEFYKPLSPDAICRITHDVICQGQLEDAIKVARKNPTIHEDAVRISKFISNGRTTSWSESDEKVNRKIFKLVKTEELFEALLNRTGKDTTIEITSESNNPCSQIRIAFQYLEIPSIYRKQARYRVYKEFWEAPHSIEDFDLDFAIFNMWNDITETGIYYVYIPQFN